MLTYDDVAFLIATCTVPSPDSCGAGCLCPVLSTFAESLALAVKLRWLLVDSPWKTDESHTIFHHLTRMWS